METSVGKGQIIVPARIRRELGIRKDLKISFIEQKGKLIIHPLNRSYFKCLAGILGTKGKMMKSLMDGKKRERGL